MRYASSPNHRHGNPHIAARQKLLTHNQACEQQAPLQSRNPRFEGRSRDAIPRDALVKRPITATLCDIHRLSR